jgi:hypothetical protein
MPVSGGALLVRNCWRSVRDKCGQTIQAKRSPIFQYRDPIRIWTIRYLQNGEDHARKVQSSFG